MKITVIDGQGGSIGRQLVKMISEQFPQAELTAVGTNTIATAAMLKGGATTAATGENAVLVACRKADVLIGPIGMVIADALTGEITPKMAVAIAQSNAKRILIPFNHCDNVVVGVGELSTGALLQEAMRELSKLL